MKMIQAILILCFVTATDDRAFTQTSAGTNATTHPEYPSDLLDGRAAREAPYSLNFILYPLSDLRLLYCSRATLDQRIASNICIVDDRPNHITVCLKPSATLRDVLHGPQIPPYLRDWTGKVNPGVRVIKKRAILASDGTKGFLDTPISPGDFIVALKID